MSGRLGSASLAATTNTTIYTGAAGKVTSCTINLCNTASVAVSVRIALSLTGSPVDGDWLEYNVSLPSSGILERGGIVLDEGQNIVVYASATGVNVNVWGFAE